MSWKKTMDISIHTDPMKVTPTQTAILLALLSEAWQLSQKFAGSDGMEYPIHVAVKFNGQRVCGSVVPAGDLGGSSALTDGPRFTGKCN